jgi:hypothetical protein
VLLAPILHRRQAQAATLEQELVSALPLRKVLRQVPALHRLPASAQAQAKALAGAMVRQLLLRSPHPQRKQLLRLLGHRQH